MIINIILQIAALPFNYALVIWMIVILHELGYFRLYVFLLTCLCIERFLIILKMMVSVLIINNYYILIGFPFFIDYSFGLQSEDGDSEYNTYVHSKEVNYAVHYINLLPLIINYSVLAENKGKSLPDIIFIIFIIYSPIILAFSEIMVYLEKEEKISNKEITLNIFNLLWRFLQGVCRYSCICACMGELLNNSLWYLALIVFYVPFEIKFWKMQNNYIFKCFLQVSNFPSPNCLNTTRSHNKYYLYSNAVQSLFLCIIFIIRTILHPTTRTYDILLYSSFALTLPFILSSFYCLYLYYRSGPFTSTFSILNEYHLKENISQILNIQAHLKKQYIQTISIISKKTLNEEIKIQINYFNMQTDFNSEDFIQFLMDLIKVYNLLKQKNLQKITLILNDRNQIYNALSLQVNTAEFYATCPLIQQNLSHLQKFLLQCQDHKKQMKLIFQCEKQKYLQFEIQKQLLKEDTFFSTNYLTVLPEQDFNSIRLVFKDILQITVFHKVLLSYLTFNPSSCLYDLYLEECSSRFEKFSIFSNNDL